MKTEKEDKILMDESSISGLIEASFNFWYNDNGHIRSPFPEHLRQEVKELSTINFKSWVDQLPEKSVKKINQEILAEKLEEIIFENAMDKAQNEDEKTTLLYPFLPRLDDAISVKDVPEEEAVSKVIKREVVKEGETKFLKVTLQNIASQKEWETKFELPEQGTF